MLPTAWNSHHRGSRRQGCLPGWSSGGYGYLVELAHSDGSKTRYAHNSALLVKKGQNVRQGTAIARMGSTGRSTGPHLHFEIIKPGLGAVNPVRHLTRQG